METYEKYVTKLTKCLPMNDTVFIANLFIHKLLFGDTIDKLHAISTQAEKASYFLDHVIKPALDIDDTSSFHTLLSVMQQCGYVHVEKLASDINSEICKADPGMPY